ncbi:MAG: response regulator transcription factor [Deltaproteobacteria bacterium]|nr:response regulator transcription factor [Deltaproteobacteria bacterium]
MRVFIADDSVMVRDRLASLLSELTGVQVVGTAATCYDAFDSILDLKPDVAVLDMRMPGGSGYLLLEMVKKWLPQTKVIVLTNFSEKIYREWCRDNGADYFFDKSKEFEKVPEVLQGLMATTAS